MKKFNHILWAVDPFEPMSLISQNVVESIRALSRLSPVQIEPVYVLSATEINGTVEFAPVMLEHYRPAAYSALVEMVTQAGIPGVLPPRVLLQSSGSKRNAVEVLTKYAESAGSDLIVVGTHGREGISRMFLGSFAETLTLHTRVPTLVVGAEQSSDLSKTGFNCLLFPTDLSAESRSLFEATVAMAKDSGARITLFHLVPNPIEPLLQSGVYLLGGAWIPVHSYFAQETEERRRKLQAWSNWGNRKGVPTEFVQSEGSGSVSTAIADYALTSGTRQIVLGAQAGALATVLIGSITRQVLRHAPCPVLILHPDRRPHERTEAA